MEIDLALVLDALPGMVWTALPDGRIDFVNRRWSEYAGIGHGNAHEWQEIVHPDDLPKLLERWRSTLASGEPGGMEARLRRFDGQYRCFLVQFSPMRDDSKRIIKWCGMSTDIQDLRRADSQLRKRERDARVIMENIPNLVSILAPTGEPELINRQILDYAGKTEEDLKKWGMSDLVHPGDLPHATEGFKNGIPSGEPFDIVYRMRRHDGVYRWFEGRHSPLKDADGRIFRWCVSVNDINDRKTVEDALRASERKSRSVLDGIPGFVATLGRDGGVESVNRQILDYTGSTLDELKQWGTNGTVHADDMPHVAEIFMKSIAAGVPYEIEQRLRRYDGAYRWFDNRGLPIREESGDVTGWYVLLADIDERRRAQEALVESERQSRLIVNTIPALVAIFTGDGEPEDLNEQFLDYLGQTFEEFANWATNGTVHPDDLARHIETLTQSLKSGHPIDFETRLRRFDGTYRWFQLRGHPVRETEGRIVRWYCLMTDIDDRKRVEEALAANERNLGLIINTIPVMAWSARPDGSAEFFNQQYLNYVGLTVGHSHDWNRTAAVSQYWDLTAAVHPDDLDGLTATWKAILTSGQPGEAEARLCRYDGKYRWFLFRFNPLRDESGTIIRWYGTNTDIDDRKRAEEAFKRNEAFLAEGQHLARMGSFSWRVASGEIIWSEQLCRIFEFEPNVRVTLDMIASRVHAEDMPLVGDMIERAQRGDSYFEYQHRIVLPDLSVKHLHLIAHRADDTAQIEYIGAVLDITQRRLSEEALEKARSELGHVTRSMSLGALTASIAHEVNQPLSGIITNAGTCLRMLAAEPPNVDGARETARRTIRDGNRAADVISRLRALFSKRAVAIEPVDLNETAREVLALLGSDLQRNRVVVRAEFDDQLPLVGGDRVQLQQVIMNLLRNAADAMLDVDDRPRRVVIRTVRGEDDNIRLTVRDAGTGFGGSNTEQLFEAFYTTKSDGMGIGLSVSRSIIQSHGGRLWAEANDGPGVTFSFSIPGYSGNEIAVHISGATQAPATSSARMQRGFS